jgi:hypothetical protein
MFCQNTSTKNVWKVLQKVCRVLICLVMYLWCCYVCTHDTVASQVAFLLHMVSLLLARHYYCVPAQYCHCLSGAFATHGVIAASEALLLYARAALPLLKWRFCCPWHCCHLQGTIILYAQHPMVVHRVWWCMHTIVRKILMLLFFVGIWITTVT